MSPSITIRVTVLLRGLEIKQAKYLAHSICSVNGSCYYHDCYCYYYFLIGAVMAAATTNLRPLLLLLLHEEGCMKRGITSFGSKQMSHYLFLAHFPTRIGE